MEPKEHLLNDVWNQFPKVISNEYTNEIVIPDLEHFFANVFSVGSFYYYILNFNNSTLSNVHENILSIHGLNAYPEHLKDIIDLIHPDDLAFVMEAEAWTLEIYQMLGPKHQLHLKTGYCFRMKTAEGNYELFYHQAFHSLKNDKGELLQAVNIHTNIHHITSTNNYVATVSGLGTRTDFYSKKIVVEKIEGEPKERLTKREIEILSLLLKGFSDKEIANLLYISYHTVRTHHKKILYKTKSKNSLDLLKRSLENGYL
ncbi:helix-turn-helix transcriptional regulator [Empedobacter falsenii]|uniref:response regulator transcription factor n=1 Tax=Empedobacter falsenii TaxID=343874 RepID=UPI0025765A22|nr:helix-turn-helix transcriptional regulator [Empedobacter falsenii]MDM1297176.1 helix-turn-helix transcriptional regulator [Empedobacter falsenii]MDM1316969.1 helix-turn-helix transcriptional regulator [Empedobacter falsenii]